MQSRTTAVLIYLSCGQYKSPRKPKGALAPQHKKRLVEWQGQTLAVAFAGLAGSAVATDTFAVLGIVSPAGRTYWQGSRRLAAPGLEALVPGLHKSAVRRVIEMAGYEHPAARLVLAAPALVYPGHLVFVICYDAGG